MKPLIFSEYRISYAREIKSTWDRVRNEYGIFYVMIQMYCEYLIICGFEDLSKSISELKDKTYKMNINDMQKNNGINHNYDEDFIKNINEIIDNLAETKFKKYE